MAKLRKMLGRVDDPGIIALMRQIETQSKATLAKWAAAEARTHALPVLAKALPEDARPAAALDAAEAVAFGAMKAAEAKKIIREAAAVVKDTADPIAEAAARTVSTAAGVYFTPTNALGYCFYDAAVQAYDQLGTDASAEEYDRFAASVFDGLLASLRAVSVASEPEPAKINWNC